jgi:hypothetical protein
MATQLLGLQRGGVLYAQAALSVDASPPSSLPASGDASAESVGGGTSGLSEQPAGRKVIKARSIAGQLFIGSPFDLIRQPPLPPYAPPSSNARGPFASVRKSDAQGMRPWPGPSDAHWQPGRP